MSYYRSITYTNPGAVSEESINLDPSIVPFNAYVVTTVTGAVSYKMQLSLDPMTTADASATWFDSTDFPAGTTTSGQASITSPAARIRFVFASGTGSLLVQVRQGLSTN